MISVTNGDDIIFKFAPAPLNEFLVFIYSTLHKQLAMEMNVVKLTRRQSLISSHTIPKPFSQRLITNCILWLPADRLCILGAEAHISPSTTQICIY